ncbi:hypothetical protein HPT25_07635 [Bacillus sp. BRMEA1]|uniref:hypothetical protein n=1 Tax=Neobacillus endophyticus TaxID=2738405 RepID=UPI001562FC10|nr:hypothetical protein [Neobacillus endophyticus]NRD77370.1 hypothetical protein [Neobacillus endophyticus]
MKLEPKMIKKITATAMLATMTFGGYHQVSAAQLTSTSKVQQQHNEVKSGAINLGSPQTQVSKILTFDEVVSAISKDNNISKSEAANLVISNFQKSNGTTKAPASAGTMSNTTASAPAVQSAQLATYRSLSTTFTVTSVYKPSVNFYCQTDEGGYFRGIVKILNISMNRSYNNTSKQFSGTVYANLEDPNRIYWEVNGDFLNNGTTTISGGGAVNIGVGYSASVNFGVSYQSNEYKYVDTTGYTTF